MQPNGVFDPGAVSAAGAKEYDGNRELAAAVAERMLGFGWEVDSEAGEEYGADPDYRGSVDRVNAGDYDFALDLHMDWEGGSEALIWPLYAPGASVGGTVARELVAAAERYGLTSKGPSERSDLWWLNGTVSPAVLIEAGRVGMTRPIADMAEAIGSALASVFGTDVVPGGPPTSVDDSTRPETGPPGAPPGDVAPPWPGRVFVWEAGAMMEGSDVGTWQAQMVKRGWGLSVDGVYGPHSAEVALAFQQEKGLGADGMVGSLTWDASWEYPIT
jgi:hypothetical protein